MREGELMFDVELFVPDQICRERKRSSLRRFDEGSLRTTIVKRVSVQSLMIVDVPVDIHAGEVVVEKIILAVTASSRQATDNTQNEEFCEYELADGKVVSWKKEDDEDMKVQIGGCIERLLTLRNTMISWLMGSWNCAEG
ncbi:hypothetical protein PsorP6_001477 [Peronosclerospora sorghi]|uniref:Uncharacterized protein n=1 Tax=Peronosclerospora sorghi TaxID=230839 RepID=A0ACC0WV45_9STRA|nr:hypothetical protein PsorP6_001477 [Peronosclerospora sorghi]